MMPPELQKLVWIGAAETQVISMGGSALSSYEFPADRIAIIWHLQVFPFMDINASITLPEDAAARSLAYFEFSDHASRFGFLYRSSGQLENYIDVVPVQHLGWIPQGTPSEMPEFQIFKQGQFVLRVFHANGTANGIVDGAPASAENAVIGGYPPTSRVIRYMTGQGGNYNYVPDHRFGPFPALPLLYPRPFPDVTLAERTTLNLPTVNKRAIVEPYSWPLVNVHLCLVARAEFEQMILKFRHDMI